MMVTTHDIITVHGLKPQDLRLAKGDDGKLEEIIVKFISEAESMIKSYTNNDFNNEIPPAVQNVCSRLVSNMIQLVIQRRDSPIIKVNDWQIKTVSSEVFTEDLKTDLEPFIITKTTRRSHPIGFMAITGDTEHGANHRKRGRFQGHRAW